MSTICFVVYGEWVTERARSMYWGSRCELDEVLNFLLNLMMGRDREETKQYAIKLLLGRCKLEGCTADGTYGLVDDEDYDTYDKMRDFVIKTFAPVYDVKEAYTQLESLVEKSSYEETRNRETKDEYGWISPSGEFYPTEFGKHEGFAMRWIIDHPGVYNAEKFKEFVKSNVLGAYCDLLIDAGWALLHNPRFGIAIVSKNEAKRLTKAQREFLYDYYIRRNRRIEAERWLKDE